MPIRFKDSLGLKPTNTPPANPVEGDMYYDGATNKLMVYNGSSWVNQGGSGGGGGAEALNLFIDGSFESGNSDFTITSGTGSLTTETTDVVISPGNQQALNMTLNSSANAEASFVITEEYTEKVCLFKGWYKAPLATYTGQISLQIAGSTSGTLRTKTLPYAEEWTPFFMLFKVGTLSASETLTITFDSSAPSGSQTILLDLLSVGALNEPIKKYVYPVIQSGPGTSTWQASSTEFIYLEMAAGSGGGGGGRGAASANVPTGGGNGAAGGNTVVSGGLSITLNGGAGGSGAPSQSGASATSGGSSPSNAPPAGATLVEVRQGGRPGTSGIGGTNWYSPGAAASGGDANVYAITRTIPSGTTLNFTIGSGAGGGGGGGNANTGNTTGSAGSTVGLGGNGGSGNNSYPAGGGGGGSCRAESPGTAGSGSTNGAAMSGFKGLEFAGSGGNGSPGLSHTYGGGGGGGGGSGVPGLINLYISW